jgi:hypothetical protein
MKTQEAPGNNSIPKNLHQLVGLIAGNSISKAVLRNSFIVNEVPREFQIATDETILAKLLDSLISTVVSSTNDSCIRVRAREYDDIIFFSVRDNADIDYAVNGRLREVQSLAREMNGNLTVEQLDDKFVNILLTFPNFPKAA